MNIVKVTARQIAVNVHFIPMPMLTLFKQRGYRIEDYPQAFANYQAEISLPIYPQLTNEQVDMVAQAVIDAHAEVIR